MIFLNLFLKNVSIAFVFWEEGGTLCRGPRTTWRQGFPYNVWVLETQTPGSEFGIECLYLWSCFVIPYGFLNTDKKILIFI